MLNMLWTPKQSYFDAHSDNHSHIVPQNQTMIEFTNLLQKQYPLSAMSLIPIQTEEKKLVSDLYNVSKLADRYVQFSKKVNIDPKFSGRLKNSIKNAMFYCTFRDGEVLKIPFDMLSMKLKNNVFKSKIKTYFIAELTAIGINTFAPKLISANQDVIRKHQEFSKKNYSHLNEVQRCFLGIDELTDDLQFANHQLQAIYEVAHSWLTMSRILYETVIPNSWKQATQNVRVAVQRMNTKLFVHHTEQLNQLQSLTPIQQSLVDGLDMDCPLTLLDAHSFINLIQAPISEEKPATHQASIHNNDREERSPLRMSGTLPSFNYSYNPWLCDSYGVQNWLQTDWSFTHSLNENNELLLQAPPIIANNNDDAVNRVSHDGEPSRHHIFLYHGSPAPVIAKPKDWQQILQQQWIPSFGDLQPGVHINLGACGAVSVIITISTSNPALYPIFIGIGATLMAGIHFWNKHQANNLYKSHALLKNMGVDIADLQGGTDPKGRYWDGQLPTLDKQLNDALAIIDPELRQIALSNVRKNACELTGFIHSKLETQQKRFNHRVKEDSKNKSTILKADLDYLEICRDTRNFCNQVIIYASTSEQLLELWGNKAFKQEQQRIGYHLLKTCDKNYPLKLPVKAVLIEYCSKPSNLLMFSPEEICVLEDIKNQHNLSCGDINSLPEAYLTAINKQHSNSVTENFIHYYIAAHKPETANHYLKYLTADSPEDRLRNLFLSSITHYHCAMMTSTESLQHVEKASHAFAALNEAFDLLSDTDVNLNINSLKREIAIKDASLKLKHNGLDEGYAAYQQILCAYPQDQEILLMTAALSTQCELDRSQYSDEFLAVVEQLSFETLQMETLDKLDIYNLRHLFQQYSSNEKALKLMEMFISQKDNPEYEVANQLIFDLINHKQYTKASEMISAFSDECHKTIFDPHQTQFLKGLVSMSSAVQDAIEHKKNNASYTNGKECLTKYLANTNKHLHSETNPTGLLTLLDMEQEKQARYWLVQGAKAYADKKEDILRNIENYLEHYPECELMLMERIRYSFDQKYPKKSLEWAHHAFSLHPNHDILQILHKDIHQYIKIRNERFLFDICTYTAKSLIKSTALSKKISDTFGEMGAKRINIALESARNAGLYYFNNQSQKLSQRIIGCELPAPSHISRLSQICNLGLMAIHGLEREELDFLSQYNEQTRLSLKLAAITTADVVNMASTIEHLTQNNGSFDTGAVANLLTTGAGLIHRFTYERKRRNGDYLPEHSLSYMAEDSLNLLTSTEFTTAFKILELYTQYPQEMTVTISVTFR